MELKEYLEKLNKEAIRINKLNPQWSKDKCLFLAKQNMKQPLNDGWEY